MLYNLQDSNTTTTTTTATSLWDGWSSHKTIIWVLIVQLAFASDALVVEPKTNCRYPSRIWSSLKVRLHTKFLFVVSGRRDSDSDTGCACQVLEVMTSYWQHDKWLIWVSKSRVYTHTHKAHNLQLRPRLAPSGSHRLPLPSYTSSGSEPYVQKEKQGANFV